MLRSVLAILGGLVVILVTSFGIEAIANPLLMRMLALPNEAALSHNLAAKSITFAYSALCVVAGGYATAWLARRLPERHALVLGLIQSALTIPAMMAFPEKAPLWGWILSMLMVIPAAWCGGLLYARRRM
ncbi:MAG TPA: hypothetical protein VMT15_16655 [Bryobacteraceae bacterium]|nr:hypothetical protein [Bryobacteraceae bacterium]